MTQKYSSVELSNGFKLLKATEDNTTNENDSNTISPQEIGKEFRNMSGREIIKKLSLLENHLNQFSNIFIEYLSELVDLNLCNSNLTGLPSSLNMLKKLTCLNIDNNRFSCLPHVICELDNLKKLWACGNKMKQVPNDLGNLSNLEVLTLSMNHLTDLPNTCATLNQLEVCCLSNNKFKKIPDCVKKGMKNLQILVFSQNPHADLDVYPKSIKLTSFYAEENDTCPSFPMWILSSKYQKLETVALNNTRFRKFNFSKKKPVSYVKRLSMKQCDIQEIDVDRIITGMVNLEELVIGNPKTRFKNYFSSMPIQTKKKPSSIKQIDVHNTGLSMVPRAIKKFVNLSELNLCSNTIYVLPEEICSLKNLSILIMDNNQLTHLPKNFGDLISLRDLKIGHNYLDDLPESMKSLSNLQYMDLYNNEFETIPEVIDNLPNLVGLDLEQNYFSTEYLWHTRVPHYYNMREALRKYWLDPSFGYESVCGPKMKPSLENESFSSSSSSSSSSDISSETGGALCSLPEETYNQLINERWDTSDDSADEFDPHENKEPKKRMCAPFKYFQPFQQIYWPAESHQKRIMTKVIEMLNNGTLDWSSNYEEGQFEDP